MKRNRTWEGSSFYEKAWFAKKSIISALFAKVSGNEKFLTLLFTINFI